MKDGILIGDYASATSIRDGKVIGFSESPRAGRASHGDLTAKGAIDHSFTGTPSQNEHGTLDTCRKLVRVLNQPTPLWEVPDAMSDKPNVDCSARSLSGIQPDLDIQVVRAIADRTFWHEAALHQEVRRSDESVSALALWLRNAIALKSEKIQPQIKASIVLALGAVETASLALDAVVEAFKTQHGAWAAQQGFLSIWLVGPTFRMTHRLA